MVSLVPRSGSGSLGASFMERNVAPVRDPQGNFEIRGVKPGSYTLAADWSDEGTQYSARLPVEVGTANIEGVQVTLAPSTEIKGRVRAEGTDAVSLPDVRIMLSAKSASPMGQSQGQLQPDGLFTLKNVVPDQYGVNVYGLPPEYFIKSIRMGDENVLDSGLNLASGAPGSALEIVVSAAAAQIEGVAMNAKQEPSPGAQVVLAPDERRREQRHLYKLVTADQTGRFMVQGVAPGDYLLYAFEDLESGAHQDPEYLKPFERSAEKIRVEESGRETRQLKLIPLGDTQPQ